MCLRNDYSTINSNDIEANVQTPLRIQMQITPYQSRGLGIIKFSIIGSDQIPSELLLSLDSLKQGLEIAGSESFEVMSLDDLDEHGWPIHQMLYHKSASLFFTVSGGASNTHTLVKSCKRYPPSSKSIRMSRLLIVSKSSFSTRPDFLSRACISV